MQHDNATIDYNPSTDDFDADSKSHIILIIDFLFYCLDKTIGSISFSLSVRDSLILLLPPCGSSSPPYPGLASAPRVIGL